jgi:hypothetical protein
MVKQIYILFTLKNIGMLKYKYPRKWHIVNNIIMINLIAKCKYINEIDYIISVS